MRSMRTADQAPLLALWGAKGTVGRCMTCWKHGEKALSVRGQALDCGHMLQEELPDETAAELLSFLRN